jgi:hypothetical protein
VLSLAAACTLLALSQEDAHPAYMASTAAAVLAEQLLQEHHSVAGAAAASPAGARLERLLHNGALLRPPPPLAGPPLASQQQQQGPPPSSQQQQEKQQQAEQARARHAALTASTHGPLLLALAQATGAHDAARLQFTEVLRTKLQKHGLLPRLGALMAALCTRGGGAGSKEREGAGGGAAARHSCVEIDQAAVEGNVWLLATLLQVLENATFTSPENAACLAAVRLDPAAAGGGAGGSGAAAAAVAGARGRRLPTLLVDLLQPLCAAALDGSAPCGQCLHGCLALLMNLTHGGRAVTGAAAAATGGGGASAAGAEVPLTADEALAVVGLLRRLLRSWEGGPPAVLRREVRGRGATVTRVLCCIPKHVGAAPPPPFHRPPPSPHPIGNQ